MISGMEALCGLMSTDPTQRAAYNHPSSATVASPDIQIPITINQAISSSTPGAPFPFLQLPLEIRLKIYSYLLPPRTHKITPTISYPLGSCLTSLTPIAQPPSPIYKILTTNSRPSYPHPTIHTNLFLISQQVKAESEPVLYGGNGTVFDFGTSVELIELFFKERSVLARESVRNLKIAKEVSIRQDGVKMGRLDGIWMHFCTSLHDFLPNVSFLDLTFWSASGTSDCFPVCIRESNPLSSTDDESEEHRNARVLQVDAERKWKEWTWTKDLLKMPNLREARIKSWDFRGAKRVGPDGGGKKDFDGWLAGRMITDEGLRGRAVWDGLVTEGGVVVRCSS